MRTATRFPILTIGGDSLGRVVHGPHYAGTSPVQPTRAAFLHMPSGAISPMGAVRSEIRQKVATDARHAPLPKCPERPKCREKGPRNPIPSEGRW